MDFTVSCFPVKIERASAGWTRAVAIIDGCDGTTSPMRANLALVFRINVASCPYGWALALDLMQQER